MVGAAKREQRNHKRPKAKSHCGENPYSHRALPAVAALHVSVTVIVVVALVAMGVVGTPATYMLFDDEAAVVCPNADSHAVTTPDDAEGAVLLMILH